MVKRDDMDRPWTRRSVLALAAVGSVGIAGCLGMPAEEEPDPATPDTNGDDADEAPPADDEGDDDDEVEPEPPAPEATLFEDFENLDAWDVIDGDLVADSSAYVLGSQSARIDVGKGHVRAAIRRRFDTPQDVRDQHPILAMQTEEIIYPRIRFIDTDGDRLECRAAIRPDLAFQAYDFGINAVDGEPDLSSISEIQVTQHVGSEETAEIWLDALYLVERPQPGVILIQFDDTLLTDYSVGRSLLSEYDMAASSFINPGYVGREVGGSDRLGIDQITALDDAGWDIGSHAMYHGNLAAADRDTLESEVYDAYDWLVDHGFSSAAKYIVYPYGAIDQDALEVVSTVHDVGFAGGWSSIGPPGNPLLMPRVLGDPDFESAKRAIDRTARFGGVTTIFFHQLVDERREAFEQMVPYLDEQRSAGEIAVKTVSETDIGGFYQGLTQS